MVLKLIPISRHRPWTSIGGHLLFIVRRSEIERKPIDRAFALSLKKLREIIADVKFYIMSYSSGSPSVPSRRRSPRLHRKPPS